MSHIVHLCCFEVSLQTYFGAVLELHGGVGVKAFPEIVDCFLKFNRTISFLDDEDSREFFLELDIDLSVGLCLFLDNIMNTRFPPILGILQYIHINNHLKALRCCILLFLNGSGFGCSRLYLSFGGLRSRPPGPACSEAYGQPAFSFCPGISSRNDLYFWSPPYCGPLNGRA